MRASEKSKFELKALFDEEKIRVDREEAEINRK